MKIRAIVFAAVLLCICASLSMAGTVAVTSSASYTGGLIGNWSISYSAGADDLFLQSVTIDLGLAGLQFDTIQGGTFGSLTAQDVSATTFSGPGTPSFSAYVADGGTVATFSFLDFIPGDVFQFALDVDHPNPTLLSLRTCTGGVIARAACALYNAPRIAANDTALAAAQWVGPNQMAGAMVTFQFGGINYNTGTFQSQFQQVTLLDIILGLAQGQGLVAFNSNAGTAANVDAPEPGTLATLGTGLGLLLAFAARRRRA
jgi:hypothetical protein